MKALSVYPDVAWNIWFEEKTIEVRSWNTNYRGPIVICATKEPIHDCIPGHALCVADVVDVRPFMRKDCSAAQIFSSSFQKGYYAWVLGEIKTIQPIPVRGMPGLFNVDDDLIKYIPDPDSNDMERWNRIWKPLMR